jgi:formylglycine-generating enzyme required for sulfatase activity
MSDLGTLAPLGSRSREWWAELGRRSREHGNQTIALVPCDASAVPEELARHWTIIPWERPIESRNAALSSERAGQVAEDILTLLSFALRVEPEMVREVRRMLVDGRADPGIESRVWQHKAFQSRHFEAAAFRPDEAERFRRLIEFRPTELRRKVYELAAKIRRGRYPEVWYAELLGLEGEAAKVGMLEGEIEKAARWFRKRHRILQELGAEEDPTGDEATWLLRVFFRLPRSAYRGRAGRALHQIWSMIGSREDQPPDGLEPGRVPPSKGTNVVRTIELRHEANTLVAQALATVPVVGESQSAIDPSSSLLGLIRVRNPLIKVDLTDAAETQGDRPAGSEVESDPGWFNRLDEEGDRMAVQSLSSIRVSTDLEVLEFGVMTRPAWASAIGRDEFGLWAELSVGETVRQRLRWIPPGRFVMGSPPNEPGRYEDEGPQRSIRFSRGFWMFDTPCTQSLWKAVMGRNPSDFQSRTRPVEQVSWNDAQEFVKKLNDRLEGLELSLPSEAQWEYACRAGTITTTYAGDMEILGDRNAPILDRIAWYSGNCGVGYSLAKGFDISSWPEKQYDMKKGGTHPVATKLPNGWGLYDMLGNVWEWCQDEYPGDLTTSPASESASAYLVIRGGSWRDDARDVRAASRIRIDPGDRDDRLGFRCGEFQAGEEGRVVSGSERRAEHREDREPTIETSEFDISDRRQ